MFGQDRREMRRFFTEAWRKQHAGETLSPLEQQIVGIIRQHPEYHRLLDNPESLLERDFMPEQGQSNPFLHLSMHIALMEQVSTDRPAGISLLYRQLAERLGDQHAVEHQMMECLARMLWEAQRDGRLPDEQLYLECIRQL